MSTIKTKRAKLYYKTEKDNMSFCLGKGIFLGSMVYMLSGLTADSNVNTAPIFWILLGLGTFLNFESGDVSGDSLPE